MKSKEENIKKLIKQLEEALKTSSEICARTLVKGYPDAEFPLTYRSGNSKACQETCPFFDWNRHDSYCVLDKIYYTLKEVERYYIKSTL